MNNSGPVRTNTHGTCIELSCAGRRAGVLLQGEPGSGKSALAMRLIDHAGFGAGAPEPVRGQLVSDDQVLLEDVDGVLTAHAPGAIDGLLEVRGIGIIKVQTAISPVRLDMVITHASAADIERLPEPRTVTLAGLALPMHQIDFSNPASAAQVRTLALLEWQLASFSNP